jgi:two-component system, NtrC family, sensor histidine kinase PilS
MPERARKPGHDLLILIAVRTVILLLGLNLANPLGIFPARLGDVPFLLALNLATLSGAAVCLLMLWTGFGRLIQICAQMVFDLCFTTVLVVCTRGVESPFVSFYLLIIIYCSLTLGRNGGIASATSSTILYAGAVTAMNLGLRPLGFAPLDSENTTFRLAAHSLGFFAVAFLGTYLSQRLRTVQKELEEKIDSLEQLQRLNELIVSSIRSGLITTDLDGRIAVFNRAAEELLGLNGGEVLGKNLDPIIGNDFMQKIRAADFFSNAKAFRYEDWVAIPSRERRFLGYSVSPLMDGERNLLGYIISFQDLTEIKHLEEEVRLKDRMAAIGQMAAGIAHEIRNPLTSMRGSVEVLRSHLNLRNGDERLFSILMRESDRLNQFVEDFLHFAHPRRQEKTPLDLVALLRDSVLLLRNNPEVREKHTIALNTEAPRIQVFGNADQLKQVFWNLAQNALKAMPDGGALRIGASETGDGGASIVFEDNGVGLSPNEKEQLFQPFHSGFESGIGLGLSIVFRIIEDHGGKISFESEKMNGTAVTVYIPPGAQTCAVASVS